MEILGLVEHSEVITNFVSTVHGQLKESGYRAYLNNVQYKWNIEGKKRLWFQMRLSTAVRMKKKVIFFWMFRNLYWKFFLRKRKNMTVQRKWRFTGKRKSRSAGLQTGERDGLKFIH